MKPSLTAVVAYLAIGLSATVYAGQSLLCCPADTRAKSMQLLEYGIS